MNPTQKSNQINLIDILFYLLRNWYWFVLCAGIAVGYAYYKYTQSPSRICCRRGCGRRI